MKIIAMYLPQYHRIPENDMWWGEGFTEWQNVKSSKPLYEGHFQPRVPLNNRYYDLSNKDEIINQMQLASMYGVDCFALYHYWFSGKLLLEKPCEVFLEKEKLPIEFCFSWANGSWTRTWDGADNHILIQQEYGNTDDWKEHYLYFNEYFKHPKYLKKNNCPVLLIYNLQDIIKQKEMFSFWNKLAIESGFNGIYIITTNKDDICRYYPIYGDCSFDFEPFATLGVMQQRDKCLIQKEYAGKMCTYKVYDYKKFCEQMVKRRHFWGKNNYGMFVGWDNAPRRKEKTTLIFENNDPDIFKWGLGEQYKKSIQEGNDFLFINAWNEWGEGTFLEPDEKYGYGYLEAIRSVIQDAR